MIDLEIESALRRANQRWKDRFAAAGLVLEEVWSPTPGDPELENRQLAALWNWVQAYRECPDRTQLVRQGYLYPPITPDINPETDWLRFERWMSGEPLSWNYVMEFGLLPPADDLTDDELAAQLDLVIDRLGQRGVSLDVPPVVPDRLIYAWLTYELPFSWFEHTAPGTWCHFGCDGCCEQCFQRPWCNVAKEAAMLGDGPPFLKV